VHELEPHRPVDRSDAGSPVAEHMPAVAQWSHQFLRNLHPEICHGLTLVAALPRLDAKLTAYPSRKLERVWKPPLGVPASARWPRLPPEGETPTGKPAAGGIFRARSETPFVGAFSLLVLWRVPVGEG
jgi:hypothetical protein